MRIAFLIALLTVLSGCGLIYKVDVQQGNVIEQKQVDQLKPGMTRRQVQLVLGAPAIASSFHQDRWDYTYSLRKSRGEAETRTLTLYFDGDRLERFEGDFAPSVTGTATEQR